ncbi:hypothetical protein FB45DRAFT_29212 [Roridomyces roridus]|uniref:Uncharacterized protein n=1 Tax=Roridomyces roridus TaxID=1738132 RepID=A0AAD7CKF1_9AGAR|nr:hypothetical protein FB45DRAFT_29212 [Roridomyces roridus]
MESPGPRPPPEVQASIQLSSWMFVASSAVLIWDVLNNIVNDWTILFSFNFRFSVLLYLLTRIASLTYVLGLTIFTTYPMPNCNTAFVVFMSFYPVACLSTSLLFFLRVRAVYSGHRVITIVFGILSFFVFAGTLPVAVGTRAALDPSGMFCIVTRIPEYVGASGITITIFDTAAFFAISFRLLANSTVEYTRGEKIRAMASCGISLPTFSRSLFIDGQKYYMITLVSNLITLIMVYLPNLSPVYHGMLCIPNVALTSIMACRVYRNATLGRLHDPRG